jgi:hypothetical protein
MKLKMVVAIFIGCQTSTNNLASCAQGNHQISGCSDQYSFVQAQEAMARLGRPANFTDSIRPLKSGKALADGTMPFGLDRTLVDGITPGSSDRSLAGVVIPFGPSAGPAFPLVPALMPKVLQFLIRDVDLSDSQMEVLSKKQEDFAKMLFPLIGHLRADMSAIRDLLLQENVEGNRVKELEINIAAEHADLTNRMVEHMLSMSQTFTKEQRVKMRHNLLRYQLGQSLP